MDTLNGIDTIEEAVVVGEVVETETETDGPLLLQTIDRHKPRSPHATATKMSQQALVQAEATDRLQPHPPCLPRLCPIPTPNQEPSQSQPPPTSRL